MNHSDSEEEFSGVPTEANSDNNAPAESPEESPNDSDVQNVASPAKVPSPPATATLVGTKSGNRAHLARVAAPVYGRFAIVRRKVTGTSGSVGVPVQRQSTSESQQPDPGRRTEAYRRENEGAVPAQRIRPSRLRQNVVQPVGVYALTDSRRKMRRDPDVVAASPSSRPNSRTRPYTPEVPFAGGVIDQQSSSVSDTGSSNSNQTSDVGQIGPGDVNAIVRRVTRAVSESASNQVNLLSNQMTMVNTNPRVRSVSTQRTQYTVRVEFDPAASLEPTFSQRQNRFNARQARMNSAERQHAGQGISLSGPQPGQQDLPLVDEIEGPDLLEDLDSEEENAQMEAQDRADALRRELAGRNVQVTHRDVHHHRTHHGAANLEATGAIEHHHRPQPSRAPRTRTNEVNVRVNRALTPVQERSRSRSITPGNAAGNIERGSPQAHQVTPRRTRTRSPTPAGAVATSPNNMEFERERGARNWTEQDSFIIPERRRTVIKEAVDEIAPEQRRQAILEHYRRLFSLRYGSFDRACRTDPPLTIARKHRGLGAVDAESESGRISRPHDLIGTASRAEYEQLRSRNNKYPEARIAFENPKNLPKKCRLCPGMVFKGHGQAQTHRYISPQHQMAQGLLAHLRQYTWTLSAMRSLFQPIVSMEVEGFGCILCAERYALIPGTTRADPQSATDHLDSSGHHLVRAIAASNILPIDVEAEVASLEAIVLPAERAQREAAQAKKSQTALVTGATGVGAGAGYGYPGPSTSGATHHTHQRTKRNRTAMDSDEEDSEEGAGGASGLPPSRRERNTKKDSSKK